MKKRVVLVFIILLCLFTFQRLNGFFVYNSNNNISIQESFIQDLEVNNAKFYDENNNGLVDKIELKNKFDKLKINDYDKKRVIITFKDKQIVKELTKNEIEKLLENKEVLSISEDSKYNLNLQDTIPLIGASNLHLNNITGSNETVCILDSGIYSEHIAFTNKIINEYCYSDDDYIGNNQGYCFNNTEEYADANDDLGHGTIVAGIVNGIAPGAKLVVVKVCNLYGGCLYSDLIKGINYCINNKDKYNISVITLSLGTGYVYNDLSSCNLDNIDVTNSINNAYANNIFVDVSSGNSHSNDGISAPACLENVTAVGATDKQDRIASYSNNGDLVDVYAPGTNINSTTCINSGQLCNPSGYTHSFSGTSFSSPHVAGSAALLINYLKNNNINLNPTEIRDILKLNGKEINYNNKTFYRIDLVKAINYFNESLDIWTDSNFKEYLTNTTFYANFTKGFNAINSTCVLNLDNESYNMSFNNSLYEYNKFVINANYSINCSYNINLSKNGTISNDFYLNRSLNVIVKNYENESLSDVNLIIYEFNDSHLTNFTFDNNIQINLTEFLILNSNFLNKTPHKLIISKENLSETREIVLNNDLEETFILNISEIIIPSVPSTPTSSSSGGSGGGSSSSPTKTIIKEEPLIEEPKIIEKEVIETPKEENTRFLELKQEPMQNIQENSVKNDINLIYFIPILFLLVILIKIYKKTLIKST